MSLYSNRNDKKCSSDIVYPFVEWKLFSGIQVSSTDFYISVVTIPGWWVFHLGYRY